MTARSTSLSNSPCLGEVLLGAPLQFAQDEGRDLGRRELAVAEADAHDAAGFAATRNGSSLASPWTSSIPLPMKRFTE